MPDEYKSDYRKTRERFQRLDVYSKKMLFAKRGCYKCLTYKECKQSHSDRNHSKRFHPGQLHYVGTHYDLFAGKTPLRVVVVGQEYRGEAEFVTLRKRRDHMMNSMRKPYMKRNPHMLGTTTALRLIFGCELDSDKQHEKLQVGGHDIHIFKMFALVNFLVCAATVMIPRKNGFLSPETRPTPEMTRNCAKHFIHALQVLHPTLVVVQGHAVADWMKGAGLGTGSPARGGRRIDRVSIGPACKTVIVKLSHPAARGALNWGNSFRQPYVTKIVAPAIRRGLELLRRGLEL